MKELIEVLNIIIGVIIADLGVGWIRKQLKRRYMRKLNQLSQLKKKSKKELITKLIEETKHETNNNS